MIKIAKIGNSTTVSYAAEELLKYLSMIDKNNAMCILSFDEYTADCEDALWVGIDAEFKAPEVENVELDDSISINVKNGTGYITACNERSVLIAVYRFLRELGCCFLRPGSDGEIIPSLNVKDADVTVFESASYRHRSVCIEGAVSYEDIRDFIEWLPKVGMNGFYNQFRIPYVFYDRWYLHKHNQANYQSHKISIADGEGLMNESIREIKKRGLLYHAVGHGWTCEPFGIKALGWYDYDEPISDEVKKCFAQVDGKRDLWKGVPMNTNLCYSSPKVRDVLSTAVTEYSKKHTDVDYLHFWLSDGTNNHCECDECKKALPSDFYVKLLNEIDEKLTAEGLNTKIVFLIYVDLLWAPIKEKLNNPDRFVLMFAPITRTYSSNITDCGEFKGTLPEYSRNKNSIPSSLSENIAHLNNWQKQFSGDSFDFDYHYMWDHFKDIGNCATASVLHEDMKNLDKIGLNGMVSCQVIRSFFPHGLGMNVMAQTLWDKTTEFDSFAVKYFNSAFGEDGQKVYDYMKQLSDLSVPVFVRGECPSDKWDEVKEKIESAKVVVSDFEKIIKKNLECKDKTVYLSYYYLSLHTKLALKYLDWETVMLSKDFDNGEKVMEELFALSFDMEKELHRVFDCYVFRSTMTKCYNKIKANV